MKKTTTACNRVEWHDWLEKNHASEREVWLVYQRRESGRDSITYRDSLEEALCFGWIDSIIQKIDADTYARKFNPRRPGSRWSELNKHLVAKLIRSGRMTEHGLALVDFPLPPEDATPPRRPALAPPDWLKAGLQASPAAWRNFTALPASQQRNYIGWILDAKKEETRLRRMQEAINKLERNERLGMK